MNPKLMVLQIITPIKGLEAAVDIALVRLRSNMDVSNMPQKVGLAVKTPCGCTALPSTSLSKLLVPSAIDELVMRS